MAIDPLPPAALTQIAQFFQVLAEPTRLALLRQLHERSEASVGELAEAVGTSAANASRHLAQLGQHGLVSREGRGNAAYYRVADDSVYALCELVCQNLARRLDTLTAQRAAFAQPARRRNSR